MKVAVIGGGIGGLVAARALVSVGIDASVLEAGPRPGGIVATSSVDGYVREHAASSFLGGPPSGALALCKALGVEVDKASLRARRRWIYLDGKLRAVPHSPIDLVTSDLLTWRGKLDLLGEPFRPAGSGDDESVHAFAARRFGAEAARAIFAPYVTGTYAADAHAISLLAGFPELAALDTRGGLVRGLLAQAVRGLAGKLRGKTSGATPRGMWAPRGGLGTLVAALAAELGPRIHLSRPVARIEPADRGVRIDGERWDGAVLAVPAEDASALVAASHLGDLASRLAMFHRAPAALVFLGYPVASVPGASDSFGFLVAHGENVRVLGVMFESTVWPGRAPEGHVLLRCVFGGGRDPEATGQGDAALIAQARHDLGIVLGVDADPSHTSIVRCKRGVAQYGLGHRDRVRDAVALARGQRIVLAGSDYRGPGINDLCADAASIVAEVCAW
ncbi:MAG TPA: protoporphyrinogen oxidase [Kofleriaceae bacterium]